MRVAGISVGRHPVLAVLDTATLAVKTEETRGVGISDLVRVLRMLDIDYAVIEQPIDGQLFETGLACGIWQGILAALEIPFSVVES